ncbi:hypothetical protein, partial [Acidaminococcus provencensis]|uniref:hypothetical protein n=1 Tax=Acidaminococcus provencensis TaxID=2058289 RepID=UPI0022E1F43F
YFSNLLIQCKSKGSYFLGSEGFFVKIKHPIMLECFFAFEAKWKEIIILRFSMLLYKLRILLLAGKGFYGKYSNS